MLIFVFDTETTSLINNSLINEKHQPHIFEFCGFLIEEDGAIVEEVDFMCCPPIPIPKEVVNITGVDTSMVKDKEPFCAHLDRIQRIVAEADAVVAHNLAFDHRVVDIECNRIGRKIDWPNLKICTVECTEHFYGYRLSLTNLHKHLFNEGFPEAHRARNDVEALCRCVVKLIEMGEI